MEAATTVSRTGLVLAAGLCMALAVACGEAEEPGTGTIRLVDAFETRYVSGDVPVGEDVEPAAAWRFGEAAEAPGAEDAEEKGAGGPAATRGWRALHDVSGLRLEDGLLQGRATGELPLLHARRPEMAAEDDQVHALEVRLRVSAGSDLRVDVIGAPEIDDEEVVGRMVESGMPLAPFTTPLVPGEMRTYTMRTERSLRMSGARHLVLAPTDAPGATFEIESVRLISQREHLAGIASGPGWQGLRDVYRETLVGRSPESIRFPLELPERAWLDLDVGTVESWPVTFTVRLFEGHGEVSSEPAGADAAGPADASGGDAGETLIVRTVTQPFRWEPLHLDLGSWGGQEVTLELSLSSAERATLGFWGSPVVRQRRTSSPRAAHPPPVELPPGEGDAATAAAGGPPQGVIVILADTLRTDHLDAYGYGRPTAPELSRVAGQGVLFRDNLAQATWTKVSVPSIFTSLYPTSHRVLDFTDRLSDAAVTLAEIYRDAGHATVAYSSILFTGKFTNLQQGYEELHESSSAEDPEYPSKTAREFVDRLGVWLEEHRDVPFFVFLHVFDPHDPFEPRTPYDAIWADPSRAEEHEETRDRVREYIDEPLLQQFGMPAREDLVEAGVDPDEFVGHDIDWYDGSIRGMDAEIGRLLARLRELGLHDRTVVAFVSDHGEEFLDHGRTFHGQTVYGELTNVPMILWAPGRLPAGAEVGETVRNLDLMPTLLQLSHLEVPPFVQGRSLLPLVAATAAGEAPEGSGWSPEPTVAEKARTDSGRVGAPPPHDTESYAIVLDGWKLIHNTGRSEGTPEFELYDHREDPLDQHDVAGEHPEVVERLAGALAAWREMAREARLPEGDSLEDLSPEELERLRSLGYVQ